MFTKSWKEMREIDVKSYCDFREGKDDKGNKIKIPYLNWAVCKEILHENGAEKVYFTPLTTDSGSSLFMSEIETLDKYGNKNRCYEIRVKVVIDDLEFEMQTPLLNGSLVVNDNSLNQLRVANAQARAFVKGVAIHTGLGFGLWSEYESKDEIDTTANVGIEDIKSIKALLQELYTLKIKQGLSTSDIADGLGLTEDTVRVHFSYFDILYNFAKKLATL